MIVQILVTVALVATAELSFLFGRKHAEVVPPEQRGPLDAMQAATLGLFGLLLAFTTAMAQDRFVERRHLIVDEANAIGTASLRADLLGEERATVLRPIFREYVQTRIDLYEAGNDVTLDTEANARAEELQGRIWAVAAAAVRERPEAVGYVSFVEAVNEMIDLEDARYAAFRAQLPPALFVLLVAVALVSIGTVGMSSGLVRRRSHVAITLVPLLVGFSIAVVLDLDSPRIGLIQVGQTPMFHLADALARGSR